MIGIGGFPNIRGLIHVAILRLKSNIWITLIIIGGGSLRTLKWIQNNLHILGCKQALYSMQDHLCDLSRQEYSENNINLPHSRQTTGLSQKNVSLNIF